jgi:hypothetical protein
VRDWLTSANYLMLQKQVGAYLDTAAGLGCATSISLSAGGSLVSVNVLLMIVCIRVRRTGSTSLLSTRGSNSCILAAEHMHRAP